MRIGPLLTLCAVAALGIGIVLVNLSQAPEPAKQSDTAAASTTAAGQANPVPAPPPPVQFPTKADYVGKIPTASGVITVEISVSGTKAIAYVCDGNTIEAWLRGSAENGVVNLVSKDKASRLEGRLQGDSVVGTLWIGQKNWDFTAAPVQPPAGLYLYQQSGTRDSWIIDQNNAVTGVQRRSDGSTSPAPRLSPDGTAVINGQTVYATRVEGDSNG